MHNACKEKGYDKKKIQKGLEATLMRTRSRFLRKSNEETIVGHKICKRCHN